MSQSNAMIAEEPTGIRGDAEVTVKQLDTEPRTPADLAEPLPDSGLNLGEERLESVNPKFAAKK